MQLLRGQSAPPCGFEPPSQMLQHGAEEPSAAATQALAASAEERLFAALRREFLPFAPPQARSEMRREIWMLEEEFGRGHPFFSKEGSPTKCCRRSMRDPWLMAVAEEGKSARSAAPFELDAAHAFYEPPPEEEGLDLNGGAQQKNAVDNNLEDEAPVADSSCSTCVPPATPTDQAACRGFVLPVLRRCLSEEHDKQERSKLLRRVEDLEEIYRLPTGHELVTCGGELVDVRIRRSVSDLGPLSASTASVQPHEHFAAHRRRRFDSMA